ncbi:MAG: hypothetical protein ACXACU_14810, partial [Candidatus Hodarchaeales archaeon]
MTVTEISPQLEKLNFNPSLNEQLQLSKVHENNLLFVYSKEESFIRILSLLILFYLNSQSNTDTPSKILIIMRRSWQTKIQTLLKSYINRKTTILNGSILPNARHQDYNRYSVILVTPKIAKNDLKENFFSVDNFSLVVFLNAEMGSSSQSLRYIANKVLLSRIIGFTEYSDLIRLEKVCKNLHLAEIHQFDEVQGKQKRKDIQYYSLPLPKEYFFILGLLNDFQNHELVGLRKLGYKVSATRTSPDISAIHESIKEEGLDTRHLVLTGNLLRIIKLRKAIISQGFPAAVEYLESLRSRLNTEENFHGKQAIVEFLNDIKIIKLYEFLKSKIGLIHPKCQMIMKIISKYETGISIITHNYDNANYLKQYLQKNRVTNIVQIDKPITSISQVKLEQILLHFTEGKADICISNSINEIIARNAKVIIAYDVNAETMDTLDSLTTRIPKIFLLSKQTNEEARFFYLRRMGTRAQVPSLNLSVVNETLTKNKEKTLGNQESNNGDSLSPSDEKGVDRPLIPKNTIKFSSILYEYGIPYSFSDEEYDISLNKDIKYPGFIINVEVLILMLIPETVEFFKSDKL